MLRFLRRAGMRHAELTHRLVVSDRTIRMRWSAKLWMRDPALDLIPGMGGVPSVLLHLDGVSVYELNDAGYIFTHRIEHVVLRNSGQVAAVGSLDLAAMVARVPAPGPAIPELAGLSSFTAGRHEGRQREEAAPAAAASSSSSPGSRRRHAQPTMVESPMERAAREREEDAAKARELAELRRGREEEKRGRFFNPFESVSAPQQCESSYDCEAPMVCCDLIVASVCCSGGMLIPTKSPQQRMQEQAIPIPVERDQPGAPRIPPSGGLPPNYPGGPGGLF